MNESKTNDFHKPGIASERKDLETLIGKFFMSKRCGINIPGKHRQTDTSKQEKTCIGLLQKFIKDINASSEIRCQISRITRILIIIAPKVGSRHNDPEAEHDPSDRILPSVGKMTPFCPGSDALCSVCSGFVFNPCPGSSFLATFAGSWAALPSRHISS